MHSFYLSHLIMHASLKYTYIIYLMYITSGILCTYYHTRNHSTLP